MRRCIRVSYSAHTYLHREDEERSSNAERNHPDDGDLQHRVLLLFRVTVLERIGQGHVAVDGDHAQVADRRRGEQDVETVPSDADQLRNRKLVYKIRSITKAD